MIYQTEKQAWENLLWYRTAYYNSMSAMYSGDHAQLRASGMPHTFWRRDRCNCRVHVPVASDIAATSADLLFSKPPVFTVYHGDQDATETESQQRLTEMADSNLIYNKLLEAAETAAALGDVYLKLMWKEGADCPIFDVVQPDTAWPEYMQGDLRCVHFFTVINISRETNAYLRAYERYEPGLITCALYKGTENDLGTRLPDSELEKYGLAPEIKAPIDELLAVHIANIRPNRSFRLSMMGRSDMDNLRDLCDALDESYSSWVRDIRLGKARTIVPVEYMRRAPNDILDGVAQSASWEFDPDIETYVAMDIDTDKAGAGITMQQFEIRAEEHSRTCSDLLLQILNNAGYSPQTFGIGIEGSAESGTALTIREKKSYTTRDKKRNYWKAPLEDILTRMMHLDAALGGGSHPDDRVDVEFGDSTNIDSQAIAQTVEILDRARSASLDTRLAMLHPDWTPDQRTDEAETIRQEYSLDMPELLPDVQLGDREREPEPEQEEQAENQQ